MYVSKDVGVQLCIKKFTILLYTACGPLLRTSMAKQINKVVVKAIHMHAMHSSVKEQVMSFDVTINYIHHMCVPGDHRLVNTLA